MKRLIRKAALGRKGNILLNRRSIVTFTLAGVMGFGGSFAYAGEASASKLSDLQNEQNQILNKRSNLHQSIQEKNSHINKLENEKSGLEQQVEKLEREIVATNEKITQKEKQIADTKAEIEKLKAEIEELKSKIEKRDELLKERARNIQKNGGSVNYIDVFLGSESFGDFIDRFSAVTTIVSADREIMEEQQRDKDKLEEKKAEVEQKLADLNNMLKELEELKSGLKSQKAQKAEAAKQLEAEKKHVESEKLSLEEEEKILSAQSAAIQEAIKSENARIEQERKEREAAAAAAKAAQSQPSGGGTQSESSGGGAQSQSSGSESAAPKQNLVSNSGPSVSAPPVSSGLFTRPAAGYFSSGFGARGGGNHFGLDIAAKGKVSIVAAADGYVFRSYYSSSYGNVIFIRHNLGGRTYTTVYAHLSARNVSEGTSVSKGQHIGYMGNTGQSYGQHLHFEIHEGDWNASKSNAVDPRRYIN